MATAQIEDSIGYLVIDVSLSTVHALVGYFSLL